MEILVRSPKIKKNLIFNLKNIETIDTDFL